MQLPPSAWRLEHVTCDAWRESGRALIAVVARRVPRPLDASDDAWRQQEGSHKNKRTKVLVCSGERCKKTESAVGSAGRAATRRHVEAKNDCTRCHISHTLLLREHNSLDTVCPLVPHVCISPIHTHLHTPYLSQYRTTLAFSIPWGTRMCSTLRPSRSSMGDSLLGCAISTYGGCSQTCRPASEEATKSSTARCPRSGARRRFRRRRFPRRVFPR